jgi:PKD repeat protein
VARLANPSCSGLTCTFDGGASSDPDGQVVFYAWGYGDGKSEQGSGMRTATHKYDQPGTYTVTLLVMDNDGLTDSTTKSVTVTS